MKHSLCLGCVLFLAVAMAYGAPVITICPSVAPNAYAGASSYAAYAASAIAGLSTGACTNEGGDRATNPAAYNVVSSFAPGDAMVSSFPMWEGLMNPAAPFNNEYGNRITFGMIIDGGGTKISLSELTFTMSSSDPADVLGYSDNYLDYNYNATHVGVINGPGGPTFVTSGSDTALVDEILMVGVGNALWPGIDANGNPLPPDQWAQSITDTAGYISSEMLSVSMSYTLTGPGFTVTANDTIGEVPEPGTLALMSLGLSSALVAFRKRSH
jgi:hypothetical protein